MGKERGREGKKKERKRREKGREEEEKERKREEKKKRREEGDNFAVFWALSQHKSGRTGAVFVVLWFRMAQMGDKTSKIGQKRLKMREKVAKIRKSRHFANVLSK